MSPRSPGRRVTILLLMLGSILIAALTGIWGEDWGRVESFEGSAYMTTDTFRINERGRATWSFEATSGFAKFGIQIFEHGEDHPYEEYMSGTERTGQGTTYINRSNTNHYIKVIAANLKAWDVTIETTPPPAAHEENITWQEVADFTGTGYMTTETFPIGEKGRIIWSYNSTSELAAFNLQIFTEGEDLPYDLFLSGDQKSDQGVTYIHRSYTNHYIKIAPTSLKGWKITVETIPEPALLAPLALMLGTGFMYGRRSLKRSLMLVGIE